MFGLDALTSGGPLREIIFNCPRGGFRGGMQPVRMPPRKVAFDTRQSLLLRCMDGPRSKPIAVYCFETRPRHEAPHRTAPEALARKSGQSSTSAAGVKMLRLLLASPALGERGHGGLARLRIAVGRPAVAVVTMSKCPKPR